MSDHLECCGRTFQDAHNAKHERWKHRDHALGCQCDRCKPSADLDSKLPKTTLLDAQILDVLVATGPDINDTVAAVKTLIADELEAVEAYTHNGRGTILWEMDTLAEYLDARIKELRHE